MNISIRIFFKSLVALSLVTAGCGDAVGPSDPGDGTKPGLKVDGEKKIVTVASQPWSVVKPIPTHAGPSDLAIGDYLTIVGRQFVEPDRGRVYVEIRGEYVDSSGKTYPVSLPAQRVKQESPLRLKWRLWPNIVFHPTGDKLGKFTGELRVVNSSYGGARQVSAAVPLIVNVKPSLLPLVARPMRTQCAPVVTESVADTPFMFSVKAIGIDSATAERPLKFNWTFMLNQWSVKKSFGMFDPQKAAQQNTPVTLVEQVEAGTTSMIADGGRRKYSTYLMKEFTGDTNLKELIATPPPDDGPSHIATVFVDTRDPETNKMLSVEIPIEIFQPVALSYEGETRIAERFTPKMVSSCMQGSSTPSNVNYDEHESESHERIVSYSFNASVTGELGVFAQLPSPTPGSAGHIRMEAHLSAGFGIEVGAAVTSTQALNRSYSGQILPGQVGVFYRQTTKVFRVGKIVSRDQCGRATPQGEVYLTDWLFTPDLATGTSCPPPTNLQSAQKFEDLAAE